MLYCPNFFWNVLQVWMTGKDVYLQMTWSWPDKTWNILCSYCLQWNTSQSKFRNHYFLFLFAFSTLSQLFLIWGCISRHTHTYTPHTYCTSMYRKEWKKMFSNKVWIQWEAIRSVLRRSGDHWPSVCVCVCVCVCVLSEGFVWYLTQI